MSVLLSNGNGTFAAKVDYSAPDDARPESIAVADVNRDGWPDLVTANSVTGTVSVFIGNGDGTFYYDYDYATGDNPVAVVLTDFNGDGAADIITADIGADSVSVLLGNGDGGFQEKVDYPTGSFPRALAAADIDRDGDTDLVVANEGSNSASALLNEAVPPAPPDGLSVSPASPANNNAPKVSGSAESGSTVRLYTSSACSGTVAATGTAAAFASPGLAVSVGDDSTTTFYATATDGAGNASACSTSSVAYVEDSTPPARPSGLSVSPASPANNNAPKVSGSAESGSTVKLYTNSGCTGAAVKTGTAAAFASPGLVSPSATTPRRPSTRRRPTPSATPRRA